MTRAEGERRAAIARRAASLTLAVLVGLALPEPFLTGSGSLAALVPPVLALVVSGPAGVLASAAVTMALVLARAASVGMPTAPEVVALYSLLVVLLVIGRVVLDGAKREGGRVASELAGQNAELDERVAERTRQLGQAFEDLERMSHAISHDLRGPLRAMNGFALLAVEESVAMPDAVRDYFSAVRDSTVQLERLTDDLVTLAHFARAPMHRRRLAVADVIRQAMHEIADVRSGRTVDLQLDGLGTIDADGALFHRLCLHLLQNALRDTGESPVIHVTRADVDGETVISFADNGRGFDPRFADKIFDPFEQLDGSPDGPSTGIGLAVVRRIVERHGGRVWARSDASGATFSFTLAPAPRRTTARALVGEGAS